MVIDEIMWTIISAASSVGFAIASGICLSRGDIGGVAIFALYSGFSLVMAALWGRRFDERRGA